MSKFIALSIFLLSTIFSQTTGKLSGTVEDMDNNALYGANIIIQGSSLGTATDDKGSFYIINIPPGKYTVRFDIIGYTSLLVEDVTISVNKTS